jgi:hypothetical protein
LDAATPGPVPDPDKILAMAADTLDFSEYGRHVT